MFMIELEYVSSGVSVQGLNVGVPSLLFVITPPVIRFRPGSVPVIKNLVPCSAKPLSD
jgi:hypothetical protein